MVAALLPLMAGMTIAANTSYTQPQTNQPIQPDQQVAPTPGQTAQFQAKLERAKNLIGAKIVDDKGERLGTVADIVLTPNHDAINYVVLSHGGTWGMGDKYFAVPWSQFSHRPGEAAGQGVLVLKNVANADLDRAPGFDKDNWPTVANENWLGIERGSAMTPPAGSAAQAPRSSVEERAGTVPESERSGAPMATEPRTDREPMAAEPRVDVDREPMATEPRSEGDVSTAPGVAPERGMRADTGAAGRPVGIEHLRLSKLMGTDIRNLQNEDLGKLDNVMIDVNMGKLAYGILSVRSGFLGLNKDFVAVPWSALNWTAQPGIARLDVNKETLTALAFDRDNFPNLEDPQYSRQLYDRFGATPYWEGQRLGFIPGQEDRGVTPPPSGERKAPNSGMTAPNAAPNSAGTNMINHKDNHKDHKDTGKHALSYNPDTVQTIHGTIQSVGTYRIQDAGVEGVLLHVRTDDGKMVSVQAGPRPYVDSQNIRFNQGDPVTITGSVAKVGDREIILASRIQAADKNLALRGADGRPLWNLEQYRESARAGSYSHEY
jgi:sporulation protein YlmC with PRC-barrel domain